MKSRQQSGFTLIELVMVIVILGILSAIAIPQFVDISSEAETSAAEGVAGALGSASAINYAACQVGGSVTCNPIGDCDEANTLLQGGLPSGYTIDAGSVTSGSTASCTVNSSGGGTGTFTVHGTP